MEIGKWFWQMVELFVVQPPKGKINKYTIKKYNVSNFFLTIIFANRLICIF